MSASHRVIPLIPIAAGAAPTGIEPAARIHTRAVQGRHARWRWALIWLTQAVFFGLPWVNWQGRQAVLFDLGARRFFVFDAVLFPGSICFRCQK